MRFRSNWKKDGRVAALQRIGETPTGCETPTPNSSVAGVSNGHAGVILEQPASSSTSSETAASPGCAPGANRDADPSNPTNARAAAGGQSARNAGREAVRRHGLVTSAITRESIPDTEGVGVVVPDDLSDLRPGRRFPTPDLVEAAAGLFPAGERVEVARPTIAATDHLIQVSPGSFRVYTHTWAEEDRDVEPESVLTDAERADFVDLFGEEEAARIIAEEFETKKRGEITEWSRKSRKRMVDTLASLDYAPMFDSGDPVAMVTLTAGGCDAAALIEDLKAGRDHLCDHRCPWTAAFPNGRSWKDARDALIKRMEYHWGREFSLLWKVETQKRGAPHEHWYQAIPTDTIPSSKMPSWWAAAWRTERRQEPPEQVTFMVWLSATWADIVGLKDPKEHRKLWLAGTAVDFAEGDRCSDPKRLGIYFAKHGSFSAKEYQNSVPKIWADAGEGNGVGRFWGYRRLKKATAETLVTKETATKAGRVARAWCKSRTRTIIEDMKRRGTKPWKPRRPLFADGVGTVVVNDGPAFASQIYRAITPEMWDSKTRRRWTAWEALNAYGEGQMPVQLDEQTRAQVEELFGDDRLGAAARLLLVHLEGVPVPDPPAHAPRRADLSTTAETTSSTSSTPADDERPEISTDYGRWLDPYAIDQRRPENWQPATLF